MRMLWFLAGVVPHGVLCRLGLHCVKEGDYRQRCVWCSKTLNGLW